MTEGRRPVLDDVVAIVMAGGQGERLYPLTRDRGKPAVPFGGIYRVIDFTLSNCLNSGLRRIHVLTQYKSGSLERHVRIGWGPIFHHELDEWIQCVPPQLRVGQRWYQGTADAVYQNVYLLDQDRPRLVLVLSGDHVYKMDYAKMIEAHEASGALATVAAIEVPVGEASAFGVIAVDEAWRITAFQEKPKEPAPIPGRPDTALVNMGVYVFETQALVRALSADAKRETRHDFGHDILPSLVDSHRLFAYPFPDLNKKARPYWRDIGTLDSYFEASMDLVAVEPEFNLYDRGWPIRTMARPLPPAKTVFAQEEPGGRLGVVLDSIVAPGVIVSGGRVERSILGPEVRVNSYARVTESVLMDGVDIGRHAKVHRAIVDKGVRIPQSFVVGENEEDDRKRFTVTPGGVVVIPRGTLLD
ncbi:MAG TPA: glucose-1-phosphate adenylyltransferase [Candidatus Polarisedimenticolaceae bacterium]|nr:glucose-1-phosphate adenylyltransferase [Candidatus Polarisedimenticolaceae bacterium]